MPPTNSTFDVTARKKISPCCSGFTVIALPTTKARPWAKTKYLVAVKFLSPFNSIFFYQHLLVHHPHCDLQHETPKGVLHATQHLCPENWTTAEQTIGQFQHESHCSSFQNTMVAYVMALHDILHLWRFRVVDACIRSLQTRSIECLYPLSPSSGPSIKTLSTAWPNPKDFWTSLPAMFLLLHQTGQTWHRQVSGGHTGHTPRPATGVCCTLACAGGPSCTRLQSHLWPGPGGRNSPCGLPHPGGPTADWRCEL